MENLEKQRIKREGKSEKYSILNPNFQNPNSNFSLLTSNSGITLIALVVTIVILLILAGITINLVLADGGIFEKAKNAKIEQRKAEILEMLNTVEAKVSIDTLGKPTLETYRDQILKEGIVSKVSEITVISDTERKYEVETSDGYVFTITEKKGTNVNDIIIEFKEYLGTEGEGTTEEKPDLIAWYDGINNTNNGHSYETTTWTDLTGNNETGATINGATWTEDGLFFDGTDDWVNLNSILMPEEDNFAIDVVFSLNNYTDYQYIFGQNTSSLPETRLGLEHSSFDIQIFSGMQQSSKISSGYNPKLTEKVNVVMVRNGDILEIWINGEKSVEQEIVNLTIYQANTILGRWGMASDYYLNGIIYSVKAYDKELTEEEIKEKYLENVERYEINNYGDESADEYIQEGLTAWYDGFNNTGETHNYETTTWTDLTGKNTTGATITGATWTPNGLSFDGNDFVNINSILMSEEDNFTIDVTLSLNNKSSSQDYILGQNTSTTYRIGLLYEQTNGIGIFSGMRPSAVMYSGYSVNLIEKVNITVIRNGDLLQIWINGNKKLEQSISGLKIEQSNTILGRWGMYNDYYLSGIIYSVRAYDRALTDTEIQQNYNVDKLRFDM